MAKNILSAISLAVLLVSVGGCSSVDTFEYRDGTEIAEGPGLFSDSEGSILRVDIGKERSKGSTPSLQEFLNWRQKFMDANEIQQLEMWLELQQGE